MDAFLLLPNQWKIVVGLGNPGRQYEQTRHNAGFMLVEELANRWQASWSLENKFDARVARVKRGDCQVILAQPQTFMNLSGKAVAALAKFYDIAAGDVLVAVDDADLPLGTLRMRPDGSSGGHHGLDSIEQCLGTREFPRQKIGIIGRTAAGTRQITGKVLAGFSKSETELLEQVLNRAADQVECWLDNGTEKAMNKFNGSLQRPEESNK